MPRLNLSVLAALAAGVHALGSYSDEKKPFAVTVHGAGFRSILALALLYGVEAPGRLGERELGFLRH